MEPPVVLPPAVLPIERAAAALEVILCSGFPTQILIITVLSLVGMKVRLADGRLSPPFVFTLTLLDTLLLVGLVVFFIRAHRESVREQLFGRGRMWREVLFGLALIPASFFVVIVVLMVVQLVVPSLRNVPHNPLQDLARNRWDAVIFAFVVMIAGGVREEIQRGFVLRRFEQYLGGGVGGAGRSSARSSASGTWSRDATSRSRRRCSARSGGRSSCAADRSSGRWSATRGSTSRRW